MEVELFGILGQGLPQRARRLLVRRIADWRKQKGRFKLSCPVADPPLLAGVGLRGRGSDRMRVSEA